MMPCNLRSLLVAVFILSNGITWTAARRHFTHNTLGHRSRHRRQATGIDLAPDCSHYKTECDRLSCRVRTIIESTGDGCKSCRCFKRELDCKAELKECEALTCIDDYELIGTDNGCERCKCKVYDPCAGVFCLKDEWCEPHTDYGTCVPAEAAKTTGTTSTRAAETTTTTIRPTKTQPKTESLTESGLVINSTTEAAMTTTTTSTHVVETTTTTIMPTEIQPKTESLTESGRFVNSTTEAAMTRRTISTGVVDTTTATIRPTKTPPKTESLTESGRFVNSTTEAAMTTRTISTSAVDTTTATIRPTNTPPKTESLTESGLVINSTTEAAMTTTTTSTNAVEITTTTIRPTEIQPKTESLTESGRFVDSTTETAMTTRTIWIDAVDTTTAKIRPTVIQPKTESLTESGRLVDSTTQSAMTTRTISTSAVETTTTTIWPTEIQPKSELLTESGLFVNSTTEVTMTTKNTSTGAGDTTTATVRPTETQPKTESLTESGLVGNFTTEAAMTTRTTLITIDTTTATIMPTETQSKPGSQIESGQSQSPLRPQPSPEPELNSNRIVYTPDCSRKEAECTRLNCEFGTLHLRHADGCERCHCFSPEIDCKKEKEDCSTMMCMYGTETTKRADGSKRCVCKRYPCDPSLITCQEGKRCVVVTNLDREHIAECRDVINPGECPGNVVSPEHICFPDGDECDDDADCTGAEKCCRRGCVKSCIEPVAVTTAPATLTPTATETMPYSTNVTWPEGDKATLRCLYPGKTSPRITWRRGGLPIDVNVDRYRQTSAGALEIVSLYHNDSGVYSCAVGEGYDSDMQQFNLVVKDPEETPVGIAGDDNAVTTGELDRPLVIRCLSHGYPVPYVFWLRNNTIMLVNDEVYEIRRNSLLIKSLAFKTLGQYTCQAFNGHGTAVAWEVLVHAYRPDGFFLEHEYLVDRQNIVATRNIQPSTTLDYTATTSMTTEISIPSAEETSLTRVDTVTETEDSTRDMLSVITQPNENTNFSEGITISKKTASSAVVASTTTASLLLEGCAIFKFGCCYDNNTEALGPDRQGCPCNTTEFGCCTDGISPAQGKDSEGCQGACKNSSHGCCEDNRTPAHGPNYEGCCLLTAFGCCPDNRKAAEGPYLEGCECESTQHRCCPDNVTAALGPENEGCGCQYTEFGCCPDRHTKPSGPDFAGCSCHTYQFGCCPDGVTIATSTEQRNCRCQSTFGCCSDEQTAATEPNGAGCDCASSKYGCCPDGQTESQGSDFLGCVDVPENKQAVCSLPADAGPCKIFKPSIMWFYDLSYGGCSRFWYRGCGGNGNRFISREECEDVCIQPGPKEACKLPHVKGSCKSDIERWYFNTTSKQCLPFRYGGCLGNANNFDTRELCQTQCEPDRITETCNLPIEQGRCAGTYSRWGYNSDSQICEQFAWSGCEGNSNRFISEYACKTRCNGHSACGSSSFSSSWASCTDIGCECPAVCSEQQEAGNCSEKEALWSFSQTENRCVPFYYTGCGGNRNRFDYRETCEQFCPSVYVPDKCTLPAVKGDCSKYRVKWYFDTWLQRCRRFYYGSCGGNLNNFDSEIECLNACSESIYTTTVRTTQPQRQTTPQPPPDREYICLQPMMSGPCRGSLVRWFYNPISDSCSQFTYGGCLGSYNRFESREACESRCRTEATFESVTQRLAVTIKPTNFSITTEVYDYTEQIPMQCTISSVLEECQSVGTVWYYDPQERSCVSHVNKERGRNCRHIGTFGSEEACERGCGIFIGIDVCKQRLNPGPCQEFVTKVYFDSDAHTCKQFEYSGCMGGANQFSSIEECIDVCLHETVTQVTVLNTMNLTWPEGDKATLRCLYPGKTSPRIIWRRGDLTIDVNVGRYRLTSAGALEIVSLYRNDSGVYSCAVGDGQHSDTQQFNLVVKDPEGTPAVIAGDEGAVITGELGKPLEIRCLAYGYPVPIILWSQNDKMVPFNDKFYKIRENTLLIRSLAIDTLGQYTCQAYNGDGKVASWVVLVDDNSFSFLRNGLNLEERQNNSTIKDIQLSTTLETTTTSSTTSTTTTSTTTERPILFTVPVTVHLSPSYSLLNIGETLKLVCEVDVYPLPDVYWTKDGRTLASSENILISVPVAVHVSASYSTLNIGTALQLACEVDGYPEPNVYWTKDGETIVPDDRVLISGTTTSRLLILRATVGDSGLYGCHADNGYSSQSDTAQIKVQQLTVPAKCTDNPFFAKCDLIVRNNFCNYKYYSKFCCKSCVEAGQLDPQVAEAQADQPFRKK